MYEETGATSVKVEPICVYKISSFGLLCYCEIFELEELPSDFEMDKIMFSDDLTENLTYPDIFHIYFNKIKEVKGL